MSRVFAGINRCFGVTISRNVATSAISKSFMLSEKDPIKVLVTGSAGQIGYSILPRLAAGDVWGPSQPVQLKMLDLPACEKIMHGVRMELEDCAFKTLHSCSVYTKPAEAFADNDVIVMLANAMVLKLNMPRAELLKENLKLYQETAKIISMSSKKDIKILMIANPANSNCLLLIESLKSKFSPKNFTCLTRLDHNRAKHMLADKLRVPVDCVRKMVVWGNHSHTMYPDLRFAEVHMDKKWHKVLDVLEDKMWINETFVPQVRNRVNAIIEARGKSSSLSASSAGIDHLRNWLVKTDAGDYVSMGVYSDGSYDCVPKGLVFGHPCTCKDGEYTIVKDLPIDDYTKKMMEISAKELLDERHSVLPTH